MADESISDLLETNALQLLRTECSQVYFMQLEQESQSLMRQLQSHKDRLERLSSSLHLTKQQIDFFAQESEKASEGVKDCNWRFTKELCAEMGKIKSPSATLQEVTEKFMLMLDQRDRTWKTFRAITHNYTPLKALMNNLNLDLIPEEQMSSLLPLWKNKQSILAKLERVSKGGCVIAEWLCCCVEFKLKSETLRAAKRKLPELERKIKSQLQLIAEKNAQIFTCEEKLAAAKASMEGRDTSSQEDVSVNSTSLSLILSEDPGIVMSPRHEGTATRGLLSQISPRSKANLAFPSFGSPSLYNDKPELEEFSIDYGSESGSKGCCHSRLHTTQDSVLKDVCGAEIESASRPITRFSNVEFQRAMKHQVQRFDRNDCDLPDSVLYLIDKMVRLRTKELRFGYDHSEVLNLERVLREPFVEGGTELKKLRDWSVGEETFNRKLRQLLQREVPAAESSGLSFKEWKLKKEAEARIKSKLIEAEIQAEVKRRLSRVSDQSFALQEAQQRTEDWSTEKREEARQRLLEYAQKKRELDSSSPTQRPAREREFKDWLRRNFLKLREAKRLERTAQMNDRLGNSSREHSGKVGKARSVEPRKVRIHIDAYGHHYADEDSREDTESEESLDIAQLQGVNR